VRAQSHSRVDPLIFFLDRSLGKHIVADALRQAGAEVQLHDDYFSQDARDEEWLQEVGRRGWIVLTKDDRIRCRGNCLLPSGIAMLYIYLTYNWMY